MVLDPVIAGSLVILGGLSGSTLLTLFDYFRQEKAREERTNEIMAKPETLRTDEEKYFLTIPKQSFLQSYKFRLGFGIVVGISVVLAGYDTILAGLKTDASGIQTFIAGMTASGFFTSVADKIRQS